MKKKIIFVDIDGVLNSKAYREAPDTDYYNEFISDYNMCFLEHIVRVTGARAVLSSTWRAYWNCGRMQFDKTGEYINNVFESYSIRIYDKTPDLGNDRDAEITAWLREHGPVENYVILDDFDFDRSDYNKKHVIRTDDEEGLDEATTQAVICALNKT